jgi:hypothetical protein
MHWGIYTTDAQQSPTSSLLYRVCCYDFFFIVPTHALHCTLRKILKCHTKTLKIRPYMFRSPLKPSSGGPWPYFAKLLNWHVDLHLL